MKITASKLKMIIAEEVGKAELEKRIIERRRARLSESRRNSSRVVNVTPQMINRIFLSFKFFIGLIKILIDQ